MKRIAIILTWFGPFHKYFGLWLNSCRRNHTIDFYILTDQTIDGAENIFIVNTNLNKVKKQFEDYLGFPVSLDSPYKLCDYKVIQNILLPTIEHEYDFWGYCDCDLIFGNIRSFITDEILNQYPYIGVLGHLHIQKCSYPIVEKLLRQEKTIEGYSYRDVYTSSKNYLYDELPFGIPRLVLEECPYDVYSLFSRKSRLFESPNDTIPGFIDTYNNADEMGYKYKKTVFSKYSKDIFCWKRSIGNRSKKLVHYRYDNGELKCCFWENGEYCETDILYLHLFRRKMICQIDDNADNYIIIPNRFIDCNITQWLVRKAYFLDYIRCQKILFMRKYYSLKTYIWKFLHN